MMKPKGASAWWTAAIALGLLAGGIAIAGFDIRRPLDWLVIVLAAAAIGCAVYAVRVSRRAT